MPYTQVENFFNSFFKPFIPNNETAFFLALQLRLIFKLPSKKYTIP